MPDHILAATSALHGLSLWTGLAAVGVGGIGALIVYKIEQKKRK